MACHVHGNQELLKGGGKLRRSLCKTAQPTRKLNAAEDTKVIREGALCNGSAEAWTLLRHSPGPEPRAVGVEELYRLRCEAGNADRLAEDLFFLDL
jgi:hypothetical protein